MLEVFNEIEVITNGKRVTWEYIGEGNCGDYNPEDPEDKPLLRFSCDKMIDGEWEGMDDASYCTQLPTTTSLRILLIAAGVIHDEIDTDSSYKKALEGLSWFCLSDFDKFVA